MKLTRKQAIRSLAGVLAFLLIGCGQKPQECTWRNDPTWIYSENWLCVDGQGRIAGIARTAGDGEWSAFLGGAYCETGGGFIDGSSAKACIGRHYKTHDALSTATEPKP